MRKIFFTTLFLFALAGGMAGASLAHATAQDSAGITGADAFSGAVQNSASNGAPTIIDTAAAKTATTFGAGPALVDNQLNSVMTAIMSIFAWLVGIAAITLDNVMYYTVVKMGQYISQVSAIGVTWRIFRDIGNIMLIFGFIAAGVTTILDTEMYGFKKALPMLLVGAVFLNFSLFFAEAVIDTGNLFATQFYQQINAGDTAGAKEFGKNEISTEGISSKIMNQIGLARIYGAALNDQNGRLFSGTTSTIIAFMSIILFIITAFVLFSLAFVLVARFVFLLMLIIISPIGFAGWAIPKLSKVSHWWWENLFDQTITAPILLLLLYVALAVITDKKFLGFGDRGDWLDYIPKDGVANYAGFAGLLLSFLVAMGLLIMVVWASKRLGAWGGGWATASAGALSFGLTAWAGRSSLGWVSQRAGEGWRRSALSRAPVIGRAVSGVLNKGGSASFDLRGVKTFGGLGGIVPVGEAQKGGYKKWEDAKIKEREDYAKTLEQTTGKFWGVPYMPKEWTDEGKGEVAKANLKKVEEEQEELDRKLRGSEEALRDTQRREIDEFNNRIKDAQRELARLQENKSRGGTVSDEEMEQARQAADTARRERDTRIKNQQTELLDLRNKNATDKKAQAKVVETAKEALQKAENAPAFAYAGGITWGPGKLFNRNQKAAKAIEKKAKRSKSEKDLESLKDALKGEGGGGAAPAAGGH